MIKALHVRPHRGSRLELSFNDGTRGVVDLSGLVARDGPMVKPLADPAYFDRVFLEAGAPTWPNGFDLAPWALHAELKAQGLLQAAPQSA